MATAEFLKEATMSPWDSISVHDVSVNLCGRGRGV
jgi:hypothetical protein